MTDVGELDELRDENERLKAELRRLHGIPAHDTDVDDASLSGAPIHLQRARAAWKGVLEEREPDYVWTVYDAPRDAQDPPTAEQNNDGPASG